MHESAREDGGRVATSVRGEPLSARVDREGPLSIDDTLELVRQVASALVDAHRWNVGHREVGPSTVVLARSSSIRVDVIDFDVGGRRGPAGALRSGLRALVPAASATDEATSSADAAALAHVAHYALTGRVPPSLTPLRTLDARDRDAELAFDTLPRAVRALFRRAFGPVPEARFRSPSHFARAFAAAARAGAREPVTAPIRSRSDRPVALEQAEAVHERNRDLTLRAAIPALVLVAAAVAIAVWRYDGLTWSDPTEGPALSGAGALRARMPASDLQGLEPGAPSDPDGGAPPPSTREE